MSVILLSKDELREESLAYLRMQVHSLLKKQKIWNFDRLTVNDLNYQLSVSLVHFLNNEDEMVLQDEITRQAFYQAEKTKIQKELTNVREDTNRQIQIAHRDNEDMQRKFDELDKYLRKLQERQEKNLKMMNQINSFRKNTENIEQTETKLDTYYSSTTTYANYNKNTLDISQFKQQFIENIKKQKETLRAAKKECKNILMQEISDKKEQLTHDAGISLKKKKLKDKQDELRQLEKRYSQTIAAINNVLHLNLPTAFTDYSAISNIKTEIRKTIKAKVHKRKKQLFKEITKELPGIEITDTQNLSSNVQQHIALALMEKERECQRRLQKSAQRSQFLKTKLVETLSDIRQLKNSGLDSTSSLLEEVELYRDEWAQEKKLLDQKMSLLSERVSQNSGFLSISSIK